MKSELTILIVSYNSRDDLSRCLPTISEQSYSAYDILIVDNHGNDGVAAFLLTYYPDVRLIANNANTGYAGGNNLGLRHVQTPWVLLLNPDTELKRDCLAVLMDAVRKHPATFITPKLLNPDGATINCCGNQMHYTGITTCRGLNQPSDAYTGLHTVPLLSGAAFVAPIEAMRRLGGFDDEYFMYFEDTDLSLRAQLLGYSLLCQADAEIVHHYKLNLNSDKFYYLERNRLFTLLKILSRKTLLSLTPALLLTELATWTYALRGWTFIQARIRGYKWLWNNREQIRISRQTIQATRLLDDRSLLRTSQTALPVNQVAMGSPGRAVEQLVAWLYSVLRPNAIR